MPEPITEVEALRAGLAAMVEEFSPNTVHPVRAERFLRQDAALAVAVALLEWDGTDG